ncbi:hypothetical protein F0U44_22110 [Nocardioides humilatus]|uniref:Uncharacterized protein n=1 Tax=Nocardioides humilatus TaxID=2607660 RepID=A0A5B1L4C5_9ACTN|nr:hypothetical protein [Nocardioides humilatus]KAA1414998.1 hypothetical protein F0U44_22110 [Nocardioides humilatus]
MSAATRLASGVTLWLECCTVVPDDDLDGLLPNYADRDVVVSADDETLILTLAVEDELHPATVNFMHTYADLVRLEIRCPVNAAQIDRLIRALPDWRFLATDDCDLTMVAPADQNCMYDI